MRQMIINYYSYWAGSHKRRTDTRKRAPLTDS